MKFFLLKKIFLYLIVLFYYFNTITSKSQIKSHNLSKTKNRSHSYLEPKSYTKFEKNLLSDIDNFESDMETVDQKKYNDILMISAKLNEKDIVINNSGMKDHLFRFNQINKQKTQSINKTKVK